MQSRAKEAAAKVEPTHDYLGVAKDVGNGMISEVVNNPGQMAATFGESAMAGAALRFAPAPVRAAMVAGSLAYGAYELSQSAPKWITDASTVVNGSTQNALELAQAHSNLEHLGGGIAEFGAGIGGVGVGMHLPEIRTAGTNTWNSYKSGDITKGQIWPSFKEGFGQEAAKVDWTKNPDWVKPATEAFNAKTAGLKILGENAMNSPFVQNTTGALRTGAEQVRTFVKGKFGSGGEVENPNPVTAADTPVEVHTTPAVAPIEPAARGDVSPAPGDGATRPRRPFAIRLGPEHAEGAPTAVLEDGVVTHEGVHSGGKPFSVVERAEVDAAARGEAPAEPPAEERITHEGIHSDGKPFSVVERAEVDAAVKGETPAELPAEERVTYEGIHSDGKPFSVVERAEGDAVAHGDAAPGAAGAGDQFT
jgi:hypothetical protein